MYYLLYNMFGRGVTEWVGRFDHCKTCIAYLSKRKQEKAS